MAYGQNDYYNTGGSELIDVMWAAMSDYLKQLTRTGRMSERMADEIWNVIHADGQAICSDAYRRLGPQPYREDVQKFGVDVINAIANRLAASYNRYGNPGYGGNYPPPSGGFCRSGNYGDSGTRSWLGATISKGNGRPENPNDFPNYSKTDGNRSGGNTTRQTDEKAAQAASNYAKQRDTQQRQGIVNRDDGDTQDVAVSSETPGGNRNSRYNVIGGDTADRNQIYNFTKSELDRNKLIGNASDKDALFGIETYVAYKQGVVSNVVSASIKLRQPMCRTVDAIDTVRNGLPDIFTQAQFCHVIDYKRLLRSRWVGNCTHIYDDIANIASFASAPGDLVDLLGKLDQLVLNKYTRAVVDRLLVDRLRYLVTNFYFPEEEINFLMLPDCAADMKSLLVPPDTLRNTQTGQSLERFKDMLEKRHGARKCEDRVNTILKTAVMETFGPGYGFVDVQNEHPEYIGYIPGLNEVSDKRYLSRDINVCPQDIQKDFIKQFMADNFLLLQRRILVLIGGGNNTTLNINSLFGNCEYAFIEQPVTEISSLITNILIGASVPITDIKLVQCTVDYDTHQLSINACADLGYSLDGKIKLTKCQFPEN